MTTHVFYVMYFWTTASTWRGGTVELPSHPNKSRTHETFKESNHCGSNPVRTDGRTTAMQKKVTIRQGIKKAPTKQTPMKPFKKHNHRRSNPATTVSYVETRLSRAQPGNNRIACDVRHGRPLTFPVSTHNFTAVDQNFFLHNSTGNENSLRGVNGGRKNRAKRNHVTATALTLKENVEVELEVELQSPT